MFSSENPLRIAIYGSEGKTKGRGVGLWTSGYHGTLTAAGAEPVFLKPACGGESWGEILHVFRMQRSDPDYMVTPCVPGKSSSGPVEHTTDTPLAAQAR